LDPWINTIRDATRGHVRTAWVGWLFGAIALALGVVRPVHWGLIAIGVALLATMAIVLAKRIVEHRAAHRLAQRP
jgi:hypothetical protein